MVAGSNQIVLSWDPSSGASSYILERSLDANNWSTIASGLTATSYTDSGLNYSTTYYYRATAVSNVGNSDASPVIAAVTQAQPDQITAHGLALVAAKGQLFSNPVATFTDANATTGASAFTATISWGNGRSTTGTITGSNGAFTISGVHLFAALGNDQVRITITGPNSTDVVITSEVRVETLAAFRASARVRLSRRLANKIPKALKPRRD